MRISRVYNFADECTQYNFCNANNSIRRGRLKLFLHANVENRDVKEFISVSIEIEIKKMPRQEIFVPNFTVGVFRKRKKKRWKHSQLIERIVFEEYWRIVFEEEKNPLRFDHDFGMLGIDDENAFLCYQFAGGIHCHQKNSMKGNGVLRMANACVFMYVDGKYVL